MSGRWRIAAGRAGKSFVVVFCLTFGPERDGAFLMLKREEKNKKALHCKGIVYNGGIPGQAPENGKRKKSESKEDRTMNNQTTREQRQQLFEIEEQDSISPFALLGPNQVELCNVDTPRAQRAFLFHVDDQDVPSPYTLQSRQRTENQ